MFFKSCSILSQIQRSDLRKVTKNWDNSFLQYGKQRTAFWLRKEKQKYDEII